MILAPIATSILHKSCTCGSLAALVIVVRPSASAAAMTAFSVAVTEVSSKKMSSPTSLLALNSNFPSMSTRAPNSVKAKKWVSKRRLPITSPPGGIMLAFPKRAISGPANKIEARIFFESSGGIKAVSIFCAVTSQTCFSTFFTEAPRPCKILNMTPASSISGMFLSVTFSSVKRVAAMQGSAAFLFPAAVIFPFIGNPPSILYSCIC